MVSTTDHIMSRSQASATDHNGAGVPASGILRRWIAGMSFWLDRQETRRKQRDCYRGLLGQDDHMLRDLGVTRLDLVHYLERLNYH